MKTVLTLALVVSMGSMNLHAQDSYAAGMRMLAAGDTNAAIVAFRKAIEDKRKSSESEYYLAAIAFARGDTAQGLAHLDRSLAENDENANALRLQGDLFMGEFKVADAIARYQRAVRLLPSDVGLGIAFGRSLLAADSIDRAIVQFSKIKIRSPKNPALYEGLGDAYVRQGVSPLAVSNYREAVRLSPKTIAVQMKLARLLLDRHKYNEAVNVFKSIHRIDSTYAPAYLEEAEVYCKAKMFRKAIGPLQEYRRLQSGSAVVDSLYAHALIAAGHHGKAVEVLREMLRSDSLSAKNWRTYAWSLVETRDYSEAISAFAALRRRDALTSADDCVLGKVYLQLGNETEALQSFERAVARDSLNCDPYYDLGSLLMKNRDYSRAAEVFERKIRCDSTSIGAYLNAGACHLVLAGNSSDRTSRLAMARDLFNRAKELSPQNLTVRFRLAQCLVLADSQERAKEEYEEVIRIAGRSPHKYKKQAGEAHLQIAMYHASKGQPDRAIASFARAERCSYETPAMQLNWGLAILQMTGTLASEEKARLKSADAVKHFRRAIQLDAENASAHFWLGEALLRLRIPGDNVSVHKYTEEACQEFKRALAIDPHHEGALKEARLRGCK